MPGKSRAVVSAEFDALTFRNVMDMKFTGPFMSVRQHPQYWDARITVVTPMDGGLEVQKTSLRPDQKVYIGELAGLVKQQVREMGLSKATEVRVVARLVSATEMAVWFRKRLQNGGVPRMDTIAGDTELDLLT